MANSNTIYATSLLPGSAQGASSTAEFQFVNSSATAAFVTVGAPALKNRHFKVRLGGRVTGGTTTNFTVKLYQGSTALTSSMFSSGAIAVNSVNGNFELEADLVCDTTSNIIQGLARGQVNGTAVAQAATTAISSMDPTTPISFTASGTFSASNANNAAQLLWLEVDAL